MLNIGEFARLAGVSVRMLRHYDQLGLLRPERVDPYSGYRSYSADQLERANRLVALKELGFRLDEVGRMLADDLPAKELAELLRRRRDELHAQLDADRRRLVAISARLRSVEKENPMPVYTESTLPELRLVQLSAEISEMSEIESEIGPMFDRVGVLLAAAGAERVGPGVAHYTIVGDRMIAAAAEQIAGDATPEGLEAATLREQRRALTLRYESAEIDGIQSAWQQLAGEVERRGLVAAGPAREVYLQSPADGDSRWVVDLQQPVH